MVVTLFSHGAPRTAYPQARENRGPAHAHGPRLRVPPCPVRVVHRWDAIFSLFAAPAARHLFHLLNRANVIGDIPRVVRRALGNPFAITSALKFRPDTPGHTLHTDREISKRIARRSFLADPEGGLPTLGWISTEES